jgi:septum formation protein
VEFTQHAADTDETWPPHIEPAAAVRLLAEQKALSVAAFYQNAFILGADTSVILNGVALGKPESTEDALRMLKLLAGREHQVMTGVAAVNARTGRTLSDTVVSDVWMRHCSDSELAAYARSGEPMDKAGAYGIQGLGAGLVTRIEGCYFNIVGLPISRVIDLLRETSLPLRKEQ